VEMISDCYKVASNGLRLATYLVHPVYSFSLVLLRVEACKLEDLKSRRKATFQGKIRCSPVSVSDCCSLSATIHSSKTAFVQAAAAAAAYLCQFLFL
jgi:hypothetical protein